jgi:hypothetical protein
VGLAGRVYLFLGIQPSFIALRGSGKGYFKVLYKMIRELYVVLFHLTDIRLCEFGAKNCRNTILQREDRLI